MGSSSTPKILVLESQFVSWNRQLQPRQSTGQRGKRDLQFDPGEVLSDTLVHAVAEPKWPLQFREASKIRGFSTNPGSQFPAGRFISTKSPARINSPPIVRSSVATRSTWLCTMLR